MGETIALNRKARHDFTITDTFEAGIVLTGTEIKSVRARKVNLSDAYARVEKGEAWLMNAHIAPFEQGNRNNHEPRRNRKLLLHRMADRRADGPCRGQGPDGRAAAACTSPTAAAPRSSWVWPRASSCTTVGATSPTATRGATWSASWPTSSAAARRAERDDVVVRVGGPDDVDAAVSRLRPVRKRGRRGMPPSERAHRRRLRRRIARRQNLVLRRGRRR